VERGLGAWRVDLWGRGEGLKGKRKGRNYWRVGQELFKSEEERWSSGVKSLLLDDGDGVVEEYLCDEVQPWEVESN